MHIIAFVDPDFGLSLNHRRICRDKYAIEHMATQFAGQQITMNPKSARYVLDSLRKTDKLDLLRIHIIPTFDNVKKDDIILVEDETGDELNKLVSRADMITLFIWDNTHLHDTTFPAFNADPKWKLTQTVMCGTMQHPALKAQTYAYQPAPTYRVILGAQGDDFIYRCRLSYEEAKAAFENVPTAPGVYKRIERE